MHYLGIIAIYPTSYQGKIKRTERLLSLAPFDDETSVTAASH